MENNEKMTNYDVITKLIGRISPIGETNEDEKRYQNLLATIDVVSTLLHDISIVEPCKHKVEYSMKKAGEKASEFLSFIATEYAPEIQEKNE